jgi:hypothetical protein
MRAWFLGSVRIPEPEPANQARPGLQKPKPTFYRPDPAQAAAASEESHLLANSIW